MIQRTHIDHLTEDLAHVFTGPGESHRLSEAAPGGIEEERRGKSNHEGGEHGDDEKHLPGSEVRQHVGLGPIRLAVVEPRARQPQPDHLTTVAMS